jgi:hypothetical protein
MKNWTSGIFLPFFSLILGLILTVYRVNISSELQPVIDPYDSPSYFNFKLIGGVRMPIITFIFSRMETYENIIAFQSFFSSLSWILLSQVIFTLKLNRVILLLFSILILSLGFSNQVLLLDGFINAESLNISALVLCISSIFLIIVNRSLASCILFIVCVTFYAGVKSINALSAVFLMFFFVIFLFIIGETRRRAGAILATFGTVLMSVFFFLFTKVDATPILNTSALINQRIWNVEPWKSYTLEQGFPPEARITFLRFKSSNLGLPPDTAVSIQSDYKRWFDESGNSFLINFMIDNPDYTFFGPIALPIFDQKVYLSSTIWGAAATGILYAEIFNNEWFTSWPMNGIFWSLDRTMGYIKFSLFLAIIAIALLPNLFSKKYENQLQKVIMFLLVMGLLLSYLAWWFGSTPSDIGRHQFPLAIVIRITTIFCLIYLTQLFINKLKMIKSSN